MNIVSVHIHSCLPLFSAALRYQVVLLRQHCGSHAQCPLLRLSEEEEERARVNI